MFLPITLEELKHLGWNYVDVIIVTGDAYVDHPSFGAAVIGRTLEHEGFRVAILPQPNWRDDLRDFKKLGQPRLFFGVTAGAMDSMVNHYTATKRLRSNDAFTPNDKAGFRPDYPTVVYTQILKQLYPNTPVILGGIEASMRRLAHYDYWQDIVMPSILTQSGADMLVYGMGEKPIVKIAHKLSLGLRIEDCFNIKQVVYTQKTHNNTTALTLPSFNECKTDKGKYAEAFKIFETESNKSALHVKTLIQQQTDNLFTVVNPPFPPSTENDIDQIFDMPYMRLPHPKYNKRGDIPAYTMIKHSVNIHRGCFGGCSFCAIAAHQGKQIVSRSEKSILKEIDKIVKMPDFKGFLTDLGGPSANMYKMRGKDIQKCESCSRPSCIFPAICNNLNVEHKTLLCLYRKIAYLPEIKKIFIGSGIRYDLFDEHSTNPDSEYAEYLIQHCVSGRLKVAPEHTEKHVLDLVRKPDFAGFLRFKAFFDKTNKKHNLRQQLIPYFISSLPGSTSADMKNLSVTMKQLRYQLEQVQDFTPTPMTLATTIYHTGFDPYTGKKIFVEKDISNKRKQFQMFF